MSRVYLNGEFFDKLDAKLSVYDHGLLYGDGVWEGMRLYSGEIFRLAEHVELLIAAASAVCLPLPWSADDLANAIRAAVAANTRQYGYIRVIVSRGPGTIGLDPRKCDPQLIILVEDVVPFPAELYGHGLHAVTATGVRLDPANPLHRVRSLSHGHMVLAKSEALRAGCLEAVLLSTSGNVAGGTEGHLFAVKDGAVRTPPASESVPVDAWRAVVFEHAAANGITVEEASMTRDDLLAADELLLAGTGGGLIGVVELDGRPIGTGSEGPVTRSLHESLRRRTHGSAG